jgi:hypothetical protein
MNNFSIIGSRSHSLRKGEKMYDRLKKLSMKGVMKRLGAGIIALLIILFVAGQSFLKLAKGPQDLYQLTVDQLPNSYVEGDINVILGAYAEYYVENDDGTEEITDNYYIIPVGEEEFVGLAVNKEDFGTADQIYNETYDYMMGYRDDLSTSMKVTGTINKMEDEVYEFYEEWFMTSGILENPTKEKFERVALPYVLEIDKVGKLDTYIVYLLAALSVILVLAMLYAFIAGITGLYLRPVKKYITKHQDLYSEERVESDFMNATTIENVMVGNTWTFYTKGCKTYMIENKDIVWAYLEETTHRVNGIKSGVSKSLVLYNQKKKKLAIPMKKSNYVNSVLGIYSHTQPHMVIGFSEELKQCFNKDFESFLKLPYQNQANQEQDFENDSPKTEFTSAEGDSYMDNTDDTANVNVRDNDKSSTDEDYEDNITLDKNDNDEE